MQNLTAETKKDHQPLDLKPLLRDTSKFLAGLADLQDSLPRVGAHARFLEGQIRDALKELDAQ